MVQFLSINFFLGFLQFLLGFSKVPVFLCHPVHPFHSAEVLLHFGQVLLINEVELKTMYSCF